MPDDTALAAYTGATDLTARIRAGLDALGLAPPLDPAALASVDEFHIGGLAATEAVLEPLDIPTGTPVIDLGCGLGGPARYMAQRFSALVTAVDLTPAYVATGRTLTDWCGLSDRVRHVEGSVLDLDFGEGEFGLATLFHVGMNIADKPRLCAEAFRVLRPGGLFLIYDVMQVGTGEMGYPAPWALTAADSALAKPEAYRQALTGAGFAVVSKTDHRGFAKDFFARLAAQAAAAKGPPPLGLHLLMGPKTAEKVANMVRHVEAGLIAPIALLARKPG